MEVKILWSETALLQLEDLYFYLRFRASHSIANKVVKSIIEESLVLGSHPMIGVKEPLLSQRSYVYRFIIKNNYKIIYRFNDNVIRIVSVFDCRQNPIRIEKIQD